MTALVSPAIPRWQSEVPGDAQFELFLDTVGTNLLDILCLDYVDTTKTYNDLTFLQGQVMMILEQQLFLAKKKAEYEKQILDLKERLGLDNE